MKYNIQTTRVSSINIHKCTHFCTLHKDEERTLPGTWKSPSEPLPVAKPLFPKETMLLISNTTGLLCLFLNFLFKITQSIDILLYAVSSVQCWICGLYSCHCRWQYFIHFLYFISLYENTIFYFHSTLNKHLVVSIFPPLVIANNAVINIFICVFRCTYVCICVIYT